MKWKVLGKVIGVVLFEKLVHFEHDQVACIYIEHHTLLVPSIPFVSNTQSVRQVVAFAFYELDVLQFALCDMAGHRVLDFYPPSFSKPAHTASIAALSIAPSRGISD